jgi:hypothetical protein
MTLTTHQFTMILIQSFWPLLLIGFIGTGLIIKDLVTIVFLKIKTKIKSMDRKDKLIDTRIKAWELQEKRLRAATFEETAYIGLRLVPDLVYPVEETSMLGFTTEIDNNPPDLAA